MPRTRMSKPDRLSDKSVDRSTGMGTSRLEAFSDGVIAIIITIMVLELKVPHSADLEGLAPILPVFLSYVLSSSTWASTGTIITTCCTWSST